MPCLTFWDLAFARTTKGDAYQQYGNISKSIAICSNQAASQQWQVILALWMPSSGLLGA